MSVMANGWGSRDKARVALKRIHQVPKQDENAAASASVAVQSDEETVDAMPAEISADMQQTLQISGPKRSIVRLDALFDFDVSPFLLFDFLFL